MRVSVKAVRDSDGALLGKTEGLVNSLLLAFAGATIAALLTLLVGHLNQEPCAAVAGLPSGSRIRREGFDT